MAQDEAGTTKGLKTYRNGKVLALRVGDNDHEFHDEYFLQVCDFRGVSYWRRIDKAEFEAFAAHSSNWEKPSDPDRAPGPQITKEQWDDACAGLGTKG